MRNISGIILLLLMSCSDASYKEPKLYRAGFTILHATDSTRVYKPNTTSADQLHYRPIDLDIWYPADSSAADTSVTVHELLMLLEHRANYYSASHIGDGVAGQLARYFSEGFKCSDSATLLNFKTNGYRNASAVNGKFPLVIYMTAFNGMSYENFTLFESLVRKGFIVVSVSSIGRFPGDMTMKNADLMEQVNDAVFAVNLLKQNPNIDINNIGIVGYSWGGLAGTILAGKLPDAKCLVSLEGSEFHHYGNSKDENADFDSIANGKDFTNLHLSIPYLRLESSPSVQPDKLDSIYNFSEKHVDNANVFTIDSAQHEDFDCFSLVAKQSGNCPTNQLYKSALRLTISFLEDHLKKANHFSATVKEHLNKTIKTK